MAQSRDQRSFPIPVMWERVALHDLVPRRTRHGVKSGNPFALRWKSTGLDLCSICVLPCLGLWAFSP